VFTRRSRTEVPTTDENVGTLISIFVQDEIGIWHSVFEISPIEERELTKPGAFDSLEELFWDDLIGINIGPIERCNDAFELREFFQF
jgi:hypothetical protein